MGGADGLKAGVAVGDLELDGQDGLAVLPDELVEVGGVTARSRRPSPAASAARANARPNPRDAPVMNQVRSLMAVGVPGRIRPDRAD